MFRLPPDARRDCSSLLPGINHKKKPMPNQAAQNRSTHMTQNLDSSPLRSQRSPVHNFIDLLYTGDTLHLQRCGEK